MSPDKTTNDHIFVNSCNFSLTHFPQEIWMKFMVSNSQTISVTDGCGISCENDLRWMSQGGRLNKNDRLTRYGDSHVKDKTS